MSDVRRWPDSITLMLQYVAIPRGLSSVEGSAYTVCQLTLKLSFEKHSTSEASRKRNWKKGERQTYAISEMSQENTGSSP